MLTGDLVKHKIDKDSFGVVMSIGNLGAKILWLDQDYPMVENYPVTELEVTSSADIDWEQDTVMS